MASPDANDADVHPVLLLPIALVLHSSGSFAMPTLCTKAETTEWSCTAATRLYSLCSSKDLGATTGYLQYRAGKGTAIDFRFPESLEHPKGHFRLRLMPRGVALSFSNSVYDYRVDESLDGTTHLSVDKGGTSLASFTCRAATNTLTLTDTLKRFNSFGISE